MYYNGPTMFQTPLIVSADANFALVRKRSASSQVMEPRYGSLYFVDQTAVDEFVQVDTCRKQKYGVRQNILLEQYKFIVNRFNLEFQDLLNVDLTDANMSFKHLFNIKDSGFDPLIKHL